MTLWLRGLEARGICGFWLWPSGLVKLVSFDLCWPESLDGFLVSGWACEGFLGLFLPLPCGLRVGFLFPLFGGIVLFCPIRQLFLVFLGPWVASAAFWGLRSSEPRGWLFVCFSCVFGYSMVT